MASTNNIKLLSNAWIYDSANSRHICHNWKLFTTFGLHKNQLSIEDLAGMMMPEDIGQVDLQCSNGNGSVENLYMKDVLYMPGAGVNLILQGQIPQKRLHPLSIIDNMIYIRNKSMFARLIENNLYIIDIVGSSRFAFSSINNETWKTWLAQLGHLWQQNVIKLAKDMATCIDLTKPFPLSICKPCSVGNLQAEAHWDRIEPELELFDFVHSDIMGPFIEGLYRALYFVTFLCDAANRFEVVLFTKKSGVFPAFKGYCLRHEKGDKRIWQLWSDGKGEYERHELTKFCNKHNMIWKPIDTGNLQINGIAKRLG